MTIKKSILAKNADLNSLSTLLGASCLIDIYSGARPVSPDAALAGNTLLVEFIGNVAGFAPAAAGGVLTMAVVANANAVANGTAAWARFRQAGGTAELDADVGTSAADLIISSTTIVSGAPYSLVSFAITAGN